MKTDYKIGDLIKANTSDFPGAIDADKPYSITGFKGDLIYVNGNYYSAAWDGYPEGWPLTHDEIEPWGEIPPSEETVSDTNKVPTAETFMNEAITFVSGDPAIENLKAGIIRIMHDFAKAHLEKQRNEIRDQVYLHGWDSDKLDSYNIEENVK
ncbi:MAG: hypothetical protein V4687_15945 [Bacteroidota bacterium]